MVSSRGVTEASSPVEAALKRDRRVVIGGVLVICALAWTHTVYLAERPMVPMLRPWKPADFGFMFFMWSVMMVAMMLPSATPMILLFANRSRKRAEAARPYVPTAVFTLGYLFVWTAFSLVATTANWGLHQGGVLSAMMGRATTSVAGALLIGAGLFQWTPLKAACLAHCRSPMSFLMAHLREGRLGAFATGAHHGLFCLGCCWLLMALLFALGVMNLAWIAVLALFVLAEKVVPHGLVVARASGVALVAWGFWMLGS